MENKMLEIATERIDELTGIGCTILSAGIQKKNAIADAVILISYGKLKKRYFVEIKKKIVPGQIHRILQQREKVKSLIIISDYITPKAKQLLRANNISYVDTAGNMFVKNEGLNIYIQTEKTNRSTLKTNTKAFNKAGLKVIFQFLINPIFVNKPYRFIGEKSKVTIATVGTVIKDLLRENYLIQTDDKEYKFHNREKLFEEWAREFNRNLKPKLNQKRYRWLNKKKNWRKIKLPAETYWGGTSAAEKLTEYLIADKIEIYTGLKFEEVMKTLKIIPDPNGEIILTEMFWKDQVQKNQLIDPMLIYAELLNNTNPRYLETANKIFKEHVKDRL